MQSYTGGADEPAKPKRKPRKRRAKRPSQEMDDLCDENFKVVAKFIKQQEKAKRGKVARKSAKKNVWLHFLPLFRTYRVTVLGEPPLPPTQLTKVASVFYKKHIHGSPALLHKFRASLKKKLEAP